MHTWRCSPPHISSGQYTSLRAVANISLYPSLGYVPVFLSFSVFLRKLHLQDPRIKFMKTSSLTCRRTRWALKSSLNWSFLASFSVLSNTTSFTQTQQDPKIKSIKSSSMRCMCVCVYSLSFSTNITIFSWASKALSQLVFSFFSFCLKQHHKPHPNPRIKSINSSIMKPFLFIIFLSEPTLQASPKPNKTQG